MKLLKCAQHDLWLSVTATREWEYVRAVWYWVENVLPAYMYSVELLHKDKGTCVKLLVAFILTQNAQFLLNQIAQIIPTPHNFSKIQWKTSDGRT